MRKSILATLNSNWVYLGILVFLVIFPHLVGWISGDSPFGLRGRPIGESIYWQGIMIEVFILVILAISYNLIFGFTGVISFGHALFFGMGGYVFAIMLEKADLSTNVGLLTGFLLAMVVAAGLALVVGLVSLRLRGVYFALFTLAVAEMFHIYFQRLQFTGSEDGFELRGLPDWLNPTRQHLQFYYIAMGLAVVSFVFVRRLMHSPTGAILLGIRENEERAKTIGYNTLGYKLFAITTAGILAAIAGIMQAMFNKKVGPEMLGLAYTVDPLIATIIGGIGTFAGPVIGASALHLSDRQLRDAVLTIGGVKINIGQDWELILGAAFIVVVIVFPYGIVGTWQRLFPNGVIDRIQRLFRGQTDGTDPKQAAPEHT